MPLYDLSRQELDTYRPELDEPADFDEFWSTTLAEARTHDLALELVPVDTGLTLVEVFDVTFAGFGGHPIKAWLTRPAGATGLLPAVVEYNGYGGGRGLPHQHTGWAAAGYVHLFMDTRGQGSRWGNGGDTPDPVGSTPAAPGFMTRGILDPHDHYYRRVFTDGVRAVEAVRSVPGVDTTRVAVTGGSQGGGITLAVAGLVPDLVGVMPDVPFLCHFRRAVEMTGNDPYGEITTYLSVHRDHVDQAFRTLSYFDGMHHGRRATAPALFSVSMMDTICPPSTVFAAYHRYGEHGGEPATALEVYEFNDHEGGQGFQVAKQLRWLHDRLASAGGVNAG